MVANRMAELLDGDEWNIIIVDKDERHFYQPGYLFIPFGIYRPEEVIREKRHFIPRNVELVFSDIELIEPELNQVRLTKDARIIPYDYLVIATGTDIRPEEQEGLLDAGWRETIFDFYTFDGASALSEHLKHWEGGRLVINIAEMPIKCPVAPLEFAFLADWYFHERGIRNKVEIVYATPLPGAFTKPKASAMLGGMLEDKNIHLEADFNVGEVYPGKIASWDEREIAYDLLVTVPTNMGADVIDRSGMGDELNFVPTDKYTLQSKEYENIWVIGDATDIPASKAGSVAHFELEVVVENVLRHMDGLAPLPEFDGHANCFVESGFEKSILIDFNYEVEPLPGMFPLPGIGPFSLLEETEANHWGKMMFRWIYWNILLKGKEMPIPAKMSMAGKFA